MVRKNSPLPHICRSAVITICMLLNPALVHFAMLSPSSVPLRHTTNVHSHFFPLALFDPLNMYLHVTSNFLLVPCPCMQPPFPAFAVQLALRMEF